MLDITNKKEVILRLIKIADIGYVTVLFFAVAIAFANLLDNLFVMWFGKENEKKSTARILFELLCQIVFTGIFSYLGRNIIHFVSSPFNGLYGFDHFKVKEVNSGALLTMLMVIFQNSLQEKIIYLRTKQNKEKKENK